MPHSEIRDQSALDAHFRNIFRSQATDFRAANLTRLVIKNLDRSRNVIDLGCGACVLTRALMRTGFQTAAIDTSSEMIAMAREVLEQDKLPSNNVHMMNLEQAAVTFPEQFDQAACLDVIEHIQDDLQAVRYIASILKPGGRLVLTVPALPSLYGPKDEKIGHYRRYSRRSLQEVLQKGGFNIISTRYWNLLGVPLTWLFVRLLKRGVDESFRSSQRSKLKASLNFLLRIWFRRVENAIPGPLGLTLMVVAIKPQR